MVSIVLLAASLSAQPPQPRPVPPPEEPDATDLELTVRALFLRHFMTYVQWPSGRFRDDEAPLVLGVVGVDPFGDLLDERFAGREVQNRRVVIRRFGSFADLERAERLRDCHVLFVAEADRAVQGRLVEALRERGVLLVAHEPGFAGAGGHIQTFVDRGKVRFEVNRKALAESGLRCSSALLKHSRKGPEPEPPPPPPRPARGRQPVVFDGPKGSWRVV